MGELMTIPQTIMDEARKAPDSEDFQRMVDRKRENRFREIDGLSPELRELVHEYSWNIVKSFLNLKVREPRHIRHLVETVLDDFSPTRGAFSIQGVRNNITAIRNTKD